jgi:8-oxo-dGTP pyrophosphatase MutT (NUDIX family)
MRIDIVNGLLLRSGRILLARRAPHKRTYPCLWSFPGGHVEAGESLEEALARELLEEIGVLPVAFMAIGKIVDPIDRDTTYHMYAVTSWTGGEPSLLGDEHSEARWFAADDAIALPDLAMAAYRSLIPRPLHGGSAAQDDDFGARAQE